MTEILLGSAVFIAIVLLLVTAVLIARSLLLPSVMVTVQINGSREIAAQTGRKLLSVLIDDGLVVPSACGGAGTCGQCKVKVLEGRPHPLQTEAAILSRHDIADGMRLACQMALRDDVSLHLPAAMLDAKSLACTVASSRTVAPMIREIVLDLPIGVEFKFDAGAFVMVEAPPYALRYGDYTVSPQHQAVWERTGLKTLHSTSKSDQSRAYSIANNAGADVGKILLLIRLALPPPDHPDAPPGVVSSWLFGRAVGDSVGVSGPFGSFAAQDSDREMVFIGGGVGMAPMRAIISDQLVRKGTSRKMSFWYGARSRVDLFYEQEFQDLQERFANFSWTVALSDPTPDDDWTGATGFIHDVVLRLYLAGHPAPYDCEFYLCGPPLMIRAVLAMLDDLGIDPDQIYNDDFGG